jgi:ketosteroid isomerase-like protein
MTDRATVEAWVERYVVAWDSNDPADVRALFAPDGRYRFHPWDEPIVGHDAITAAWLEGRDEVGDHAFTWEVLAVDGDTAVIQGHTAYTAGEAGRAYENLWILRLGPDGRATDFTEWYMERAKES